MRWFGLALMIVGAGLAGGAALAERPTDAEQAAFFESKVRPLLIAKCHECHAADKPKSGLRLDSREAILAGGESGPAAIAGKPDQSLLIDVISYRNSIQMPPRAKLSDPEIAILTEWVQRELPWPDSKNIAPVTPANHGASEFTDEQKAFWAFQPLKRQLPPAIRDNAWIRSPVDRFVLSGLEASDLKPARQADRRTLIRRVTIDLIGLLPTPDETQEFLADETPDALERVVDRLLASPHYGERWGRHWLDVARYADSNGLDENLAYANAFRYRDYVVKAFNQDLPYDQFLIEQIAGDLLDTDGVADSEQFDRLTATGFLCLGAKMLAEDDPVKMQMDIIDEQVDTIARAVMGLTMGCARCHDHKYDPLTMDDYYGLAGIFKSTQTMDNFTVVARWHERPLATASQIQQRDQLQQLATAQKQIVDKIRNDASDKILDGARQQIKDYLLAATWELLSEERLRTAKPWGQDPQVIAMPGVILLEAEDFARGNVLKEHNGYGKGIGILVNRGHTPNFAEYDLTVDRTMTCQIELRYAAAASRPVKLFVNRSLVKTDAAAKVTGTWSPDSQAWFIEGLIELKAGTNVLRLEQPQFFPHIDKVLIVPVDLARDQLDSLTALGLKPNLASRSNLVFSVVNQWKKAIERSKNDEASILTAWRQFIESRQLTADAAAFGNGVQRLLGETQPASLVELADRYERLFTEAQQAWSDLKATESGRDATTLADPAIEKARLLLSDPKGPLAVPADIEEQFSPEIAAQLKSSREELARREATVPKFTETMAVADAKPENLRIHLRGSHLTLGRETPRQLPRILTTSQSRSLTDGSGRLPFARWLASREHPLTSRVMVNRIWQWHFGQGLVRSSDNFGRLGERPTHPELLDWLASEFTGSVNGEDIAQQGMSPRAWSLKSFHRRLLETAAYRQGSDYQRVPAQVDAENRLLWRFPRQRMDVEVLRDSLLQLGGRLDETIGGSLLPTANRSYVTSTANVNPAIYTSNRRSIYLPVIRSALFELFTAFDFADPSTLSGQRDQTTVAPQALFMMNSAFVLEQCRLLSDRLRNEAGSDPTARIRRLYEMAYGRYPSAAEVSRASGYLDRLKSALEKQGVANSEIETKLWTSLSRAILSANEYVYIE